MDTSPPYSAPFNRLGLPALIDRNASRSRDLVLALIVDRVIDARSKLATARALAPESSVSTLGQTLGLGDIDPQELYAAMDWLVPRQDAIERRLAKRHLQEHTLVLYDLTSSYVEGTHCPAGPARPQPRPQAGHAADSSSACSARPRAARSPSRSSRARPATR